MSEKLERQIEVLSTMTLIDSDVEDVLDYVEDYYYVCAKTSEAEPHEFCVCETTKYDANESVFQWCLAHNVRRYMTFRTLTMEEYFESKGC